MSHDQSAYGLWFLVGINSAIFIMFTYSFFKPATARDWRTFGAFSAFIVALFVEMYGFPLTIYVLSGWLQTRYPGLDLLSHNAGHLWSTLLGEKGNPHFGILHIASYVALACGFTCSPAPGRSCTTPNAGIRWRLQVLIQSSGIRSTWRSC